MFAVYCLRHSCPYACGVRGSLPAGFWDCLLDQCGREFVWASPEFGRGRPIGGDWSPLPRELDAGIGRRGSKAGVQVRLSARAHLGSHARVRTVGHARPRAFPSFRGCAILSGHTQHPGPPHCSSVATLAQVHSSGFSALVGLLAPTSACSASDRLLRSEAFDERKGHRTASRRAVHCFASHEPA